jgi:hypothetical protein
MWHRVQAAARWAQKAQREAGNSSESHGQQSLEIWQIIWRSFLDDIADSPTSTSQLRFFWERPGASAGK